jgi:hypothetical protein
MDAILAMIAVLANISTAARLLCYRRGCSRYRPGVSAMAYVLIVCAGGQAIDTLVNAAPVTPWGAGFAAVIAVLVWRAKGNVASIVRCGHA